MKTTVRKEEIVVPQGVFAAVASVIAEHSLDHTITDADADEDEESITLSITYTKEERDAFRQIQDLIEDHEEEDDEEEDDE